MSDAAPGIVGTRLMSVGTWRENVPTKACAVKTEGYIKTKKTRILRERRGF
jgi:hypothetical protein